MPRRTARPTLEPLEPRDLPATLLGLTFGGDALYRFESDRPDAGVTVPISGLGGEQLMSIEVRAADGQVYGLSTVSHVFRIDPDTGAATQAGSVSYGGLPVGFDFDAATDRLSLISVTLILAIPPNPPIRLPAGVSYDPNDDWQSAGGVDVHGVSSGDLATVPGGGLYLIDTSTDSLIGPSGSPVGPLGLPVNVRGASFDIAPDGTAYAALSATEGGNTVARLYRIDLATGSAVGGLSFGAVGVSSLAYLRPSPPAVEARVPAALPAAAPALTGDASGAVSLSLAAVKGKPGARTRRQRWTFRNTSGQPLRGPLTLTVSGLGKRVKLVGGPLSVALPGGVLGPGEEVTFALMFSTPNGRAPKCRWRLTAG